MAKVYFLYSDEQIKEKNNILAQTGKQFEPGVVTLQGARVKFTQLAKSVDALSRFVDTKVIASGEQSDFTYVMPKNVVKRKG
jgi:hypothetical protein